MRKRVKGMGQRADEHPNGPGPRRGRGATTTLVECTTVRRTRIDEQRIHGAVEQHDVTAGVQGVQGIQLTDHQERPFNPSLFWSGYRPSQGRDMQGHDPAIGILG